MTDTVPTTTIRVTDEQIAELRRYLDEENADRRDEGLEPFDIDEELHREVVHFEHCLYMDRLRPLIEQMFAQYPGSPGIPGRIRGHLQLYAAGIRALRDEQGVVPPHPIRFDLVRFLELYEQGELDRWGGAFRVVEPKTSEPAMAR
jgi:hypothetical protein